MKIELASLYSKIKAIADEIGEFELTKEDMQNDIGSICEVENMLHYMSFEWEAKIRCNKRE